MFHLEEAVRVYVCGGEAIQEHRLGMGPGGRAGSAAVHSSALPPSLPGTSPSSLRCDSCSPRRVGPGSGGLCGAEDLNVILIGTGTEDFKDGRVCVCGILRSHGG